MNELTAVDSCRYVALSPLVNVVIVARRSGERCILLRVPETETAVQGF